MHLYYILCLKCAEFSDINVVYFDDAVRARERAAEAVMWRTEGVSVHTAVEQYGAESVGAVFSLSVFDFWFLLFTDLCPER